MESANNCFCILYVLKIANLLTFYFNCVNEVFFCLKKAYLELWMLIPFVSTDNTID